MVNGPSRVLWTGPGSRPRRPVGLSRKHQRERTGLGRLGSATGTRRCLPRRDGSHSAVASMTTRASSGQSWLCSSQPVRLERPAIGVWIKERG